MISNGFGQSNEPRLTTIIVFNTGFTDFSHQGKCDISSSEITPDVSEKTTQSFVNI